MSVPYPYLWIAGILCMLAHIVILIRKSDFVESYSAKKFEREWIVSAKQEQGLKYRDKPGCYVIFIYRFPHIMPWNAGYSAVY